MIPPHDFSQVGGTGCVRACDSSIPEKLLCETAVFHPLFFHFTLQVKSGLEAQLKANGMEAGGSDWQRRAPTKKLTLLSARQQRVRKGWSIAGGADNSSKCCI